MKSWGEGTTGATGLALAATTSADITVMAVGLPDLDGILAARKIMQTHPHAILLLTSHNDKATIDRSSSRCAKASSARPTAIIASSIRRELGAV